ncbi:MAG: 50S ribosomal protein L3 [Candidatus Marinimicrobia bacterium]|jgi:large subunit ribosomal protein L3|nr:50S ribosomal protein L3 [Candidatus Neomarinimicrobiota bacterium]MDP6836506.1 50S ribosomal protein L3 [Candidatus Neomarinimicrobiota bacterium]|tara:strand:- start:16468 stop:17085 length:618 start_codon:yes stop_codon:yes gene_type:complete
MTGLIGKKMGMTRLFDKDGRSVPVTVIEAGPCVVTQVKTEESDGYVAVQLGFEDKKEVKTNRSQAGHFKKAGVSPKRYLAEFAIDRGRSPKTGDEYSVEMFKDGDYVQIKGVSKGKGFTGVVKRYGFGGGPKTHGQSDRLRAPGSIGQASDPSRVWPGTKMPGRHGNRTTLVDNLEVVKVDSDNNNLFIKGAVPGGRNGIVIVTK